jgi:hypothetical protein
VLAATGENLGTGNGGVLSYEPDALGRVCARAGVDVPTHQHAYRDRFGRAHLPFESVLEIARSFATAEPATVLSCVEAAEHDDEVTLRDPYERSVLLIADQRTAGRLRAGTPVGRPRRGSC